MSFTFEKIYILWFHSFLGINFKMIVIWRVALCAHPKPGCADHHEKIKWYLSAYVINIIRTRWLICLLCLFFSNLFTSKIVLLNCHKILPQEARIPHPSGNVWRKINGMFLKLRYIVDLRVSFEGVRKLLNLWLCIKKRGLCYTRSGLPVLRTSVLSTGSPSCSFGTNLFFPYILRDLNFFPF